MTSSESEGPPASRKRSRKSDSAEDGGPGGKKARGRPRVDTKDATAADVSISTSTPDSQQTYGAFYLHAIGSFKYHHHVAILNQYGHCLPRCTLAAF